MKIFGIGVAPCLVYCLLTLLCLAMLTSDSSALEGVGGAQTLSLDEAYRLAVANEEQIHIAGRELAKAQLQPWRALTQLTPRADLTGSYIRNKEELAFTFPEGFWGAGGTTALIRPLATWHGTFMLTQPILQASFFPSRRLSEDL